MKKPNIALLADSYKYSHHKQYPENTEWIFDYMEARGGDYPVTLFFGLQYYIKEYLTRQITKEEVEYANMRITKHMGPGLFNYDGWMRIVNEFNGRLPLRIRAVKEGTVVPVKHVLMTIENTHPDFAWLPGQFETLLMKVWAPTTVATTALMNRMTILKHLEKSGNPESIWFKVQDFGYRGVSSEESAGITGCAALVSSMGTDTVAGIEFALEYYNCDMAGFSIPASEHSTMTILGREGEYQQIERFVDVYADAKLKACVLDSYDIDKSIEFVGTLKSKLAAQGSILVARPDSGDPIEMAVRCAKKLEASFGTTMNEKKYKVLNGVCIIYGDGIKNHKVIDAIYEALEAEGFSADNLAVGQGGGLLQMNNRDTQKFAIKCSAAIVDGQLRVVQKDPITDQGKKSKAGIQTLYKRKEGYMTYPLFTKEEWDKNENSELVTVFENGHMMMEYSLDKIRGRAVESVEFVKHLFE